MKKSIKKKAAEEEVSATEVEVGAEGAAAPGQALLHIAAGQRRTHQHPPAGRGMGAVLVYPQRQPCPIQGRRQRLYQRWVAFPYEANGSQIIVTLPNGDQKIYGSEDIGQNYEDPIHLFGRVNLGSPSNLSPESDEYLKLLEKRVQERKDKLAAVGYTEEADIPLELISASGSGVDPHISPDAAYFQVPAVVAARTKEGWKIVTDADGNVTPLAPDAAATYEPAEGETVSDFTEDYVKSVIKKYTEGRFLGIFGEKTVNVLLVNLTLDGIL